MNGTKEIREKFRSEATAHLREAEKLIQSFANDTSQTDYLHQANRHFHALKGSAPLVGARPLSDVARTLEACLKHVLTDPAVFTPALHVTLRFAIGLMNGQVEDFFAGVAIREGEGAMKAVRSHLPAAQSVQELLKNVELFSRELRNSLGETLQNILSRELDEGKRLYVLHVPPHDGMQAELPQIRSALKGYGSILSVAGREEGSVHLLVSSSFSAEALSKELGTFQAKLTELVTRVVEKRERSTSAGAAISAPQTSRDGKIRVLFSDDSQIARDLYKILLQRNGYDVEVAGDGEEALQRLKESAFDAVITDDQMPGMDGIEVLRIARDDEALKKIPFIVISGHASEEARANAMAIGATAYLVKGDFEKEELLVILRKALEGG